MTHAVRKRTADRGSECAGIQGVRVGLVQRVTAGQKGAEQAPRGRAFPAGVPWAKAGGWLAMEGEEGGVGGGSAYAGGT